MNKGMSLIEIVITILIVSSLTAGFASFYKFLNVLDNITALRSIDYSFQEIKEIVKYNSCNSFVGKKFASGTSNIKIPTIINSQGFKLYTSSKSPSFDLKKHSLDEGVVIKDMTLEKPKNGQSLFKVTYEYGEGITKLNDLLLSITLDSEGVITNCQNLQCKQQYVVPKIAAFSSECSRAIESEQLEIQNWINKNKNIAQNEIPFLIFNIPLTQSGSSVKKIITKHYPPNSIETNSIETNCICLGIFTCYQGYLSETVKCFKTNHSVENI